jgi:mRNA interferase MazF
MAIRFHPEIGAVVICDFTSFVSPEMTKRRPAIDISPRFRERAELCTVVPLSTTPPPVVMPYHHKLFIAPVLPTPYDHEFHWVKADMVYSVSFARLYLFHKKDEQGKRIYDVRTIGNSDLVAIQKCVLHGIGLTALTSQF